MTVAVYPGTFDPITLGHVDVIRRASTLFDCVVMGVADSERKQPFFNLEKRVAMAKIALDGMPNVEVAPFTGLTVDFAKTYEASHLLRGLRTAKDFEYEIDIAHMNADMSDGTLETVFLPASNQYGYVSSSMVRELILIKAFDQLKHFLPEAMLRFLS